MKIISPSLLCADLLHLEEVCNMLNESNAQWFHLDIMDGIFVPNISFGMPVVEAIRKTTMKTLDAHLMISNPDNYINRFRDIGVDWISVHIETTPHIHRTITSIKEAGMKAGVALCPGTPLYLIEDILCELDYVLLMSVNPGFGGQQFIPNVFNKLRKLSGMIESEDCHALIQVDGGVTVENSAQLYEDGADCLVAGNTVFKSENPKETINKILGLA